MDKGGKVPVLSHKKMNNPHHPYYIRYINDRPVAYHGPRDVVVGNINKDSVWCYNRSKFVPIDSLTVE